MMVDYQILIIFLITAIGFYFVGFAMGNREKNGRIFRKKYVK